MVSTTAPKSKLFDLFFGRDQERLSETYGPPDGEQYGELIKEIVGSRSIDEVAKLNSADLDLARLEFELRRFSISHNAIDLRQKCLRSLGRHEEANQALAIGIALFPNSPIMLVNFVRQFSDQVSPEASQALMERGFEAYKYLHPEATAESYQAWFLRKSTPLLS